MQILIAIGLLIGSFFSGFSGSVVVDATGCDGLPEIVEEVSRSYPQRRCYVIVDGQQTLRAPWNVRLVHKQHIRASSLHKGFVRKWTEGIPHFVPGPIFAHVDAPFIAYDFLKGYHLRNTIYVRWKEGIVQRISDCRELKPELIRLRDRAPQGEYD